jgi:hypothetical protein
MDPAPIKQCFGNRYCNYKGRFCSQRLLIMDASESVLIGGCWFESFAHPDEPKRFVCNRCAHKSVLFDTGTSSTRTWLLRCPFDGEPLGRDGAATLFDQHGASVATFPTLPSAAELKRLLIGSRLEALVDTARTPDDLLAGAIESFKLESFGQALLCAERVLEMDGSIRLATIIRARCLQKQGRSVEARAILERLVTNPAEGRNEN